MSERLVQWLILGAIVVFGGVVGLSLIVGALRVSVSCQGQDFLFVGGLATIAVTVHLSLLVYRGMPR